MRCSKTAPRKDRLRYCLKYLNGGIAVNIKKTAAAALAAAMLAVPYFGSGTDVFADGEKAAVYCDIRGYEDFFYFPVTGCDGEKYYMYVSNFGNGCEFSMDTSAKMSGFQYRSAFAANMPAKEYKNISLKKAKAYLDKYDFRAMEPGNWSGYESEDYSNMSILEQRSLKYKMQTEYANKCIAVLENLKLTKKFDGDEGKLSPAPYNETVLKLDIEIVEYQLYTDISAEFFDYNGKTVVKLSGTDFSDVSELIEKNKKTVPKFEEAKEAYYKSSSFEGYFCCDPAPLGDYFGKIGEQLAKKAKTYYKDPFNTGKTLPKEELDGKPLSYFIDSKGNKPKDSEYYVAGGAAVCPPHGVNDYRVYGDLLYFGTPQGHEFRVWEIEKADAGFPEDTEFRVKLSGKLFGSPCRYYEYYSSERAYTAILKFKAGGNWYKAEATAYYDSWDSGFRELFREFFESVKPADELEKIKFGKAPSDYFKKYRISKKEYTSACGDMELWIPKGLSELRSDDTYFSAAAPKDRKAMQISVSLEKSYDGEPLSGLYKNYHRTAYHKNSSVSAGAIESKLKKLYNFKRGGNSCTLAIKEEMDFVWGWQTVYEYYIDCGDSIYSVYITVPEGSNNTEEDVVKVLSSIKIN